ncbi:serum response factor-binding protein 1 [Ixodes scapularis]
MEKLEINNEILTLKREMKIGRVHLLRRLIAQVKKLENAKGTDEQRTKKKQKAERWMQQVKVLQKANLDSLARKAMVSEECWLKVISEPKSTLEERALARLLNLKKVQDFVTSFRKEHPEWKSWVPQLVEMWDEKKARRLSYKAKGAGPTGANATEIGDPGMQKKPVKRKRQETVKKPRSPVDEGACDTDISEGEEEGKEEEEKDDDDKSDDSDDIGEVANDTICSEDDSGETERKKVRVADPKPKRPVAVKQKRPPEKMVRKQRSNVKETVLPRGWMATSGATKEAPQMSTKVKGSVLVAAVDMTQLQGKQDDGQLRFAPADEEPRSDDDGTTDAAKESVKKRDPFFCKEGDDDDDDMEDDEEEGGLHGRPSVRERFHRDDDDDDDDEGGSVRKSGRGFHRDGGGRFSRLPRGGRPFRGRGGGFGRGDGFRGRDGFRGNTRGRGRGAGRGFDRDGGGGRGRFERDRGGGRGGFERGRGRDDAGRGGRSLKRSHDAQRGSADGGKEQTDGPVHPSWAAKQQQKVKLANLSAFQGKKITFD